MRCRVGHEQGRICQLLLDRLLDHVLVDALHPVLAHQLLEVLDRVRVRRPGRLRQAAQISRRRIVSNLIFRVSIGHSPRRTQHHRADQRPQMWRPSGLILQLARPNLLDQLLERRPVQLVGESHQPVVLLDLDHRLD